MPDVFISHAEEDQQLVLDLASRWEEAGYTTWYYERDSSVWTPFLRNIPQAIQDSRAILVLVSLDTFASSTVHCELVHAHNENKPFFPVLCEMSYAELVNKKIEWAFIFADQTAIKISKLQFSCTDGENMCGAQSSGHRSQRKIRSSCSER